jgi:hypothetical protein
MNNSLTITDEIQLNSSWIDGRYLHGEINVRMSTVEVYSEDFFAHGEDAERIIEEILWIYDDSEFLTPEQALNQWIQYNF